MGVDSAVQPDFSGYATKTGLKCADGRTIMADAFKHMDGQIVPLVWQHGHDSPENVLGHVQLEAKKDGMFCHAFFNDTPWGKTSKKLVQHGDVKSLSIYANQLTEKMKQVFHGFIREVSLVLSGANPGALIDPVTIQHDGGEIETLDDAAFIFTGLDFLVHDDLDDDEDDLDDEDDEDDLDDDDDDDEDETDSSARHSADDETVEDVFNTLSDKQKRVVDFMLAIAAGKTDGEAAQSAVGSEASEEGVLAHQEGKEIVKNVFDQSKPAGKAATGTQHVLTHDAMRGIVSRAVQMGSLKHAFGEYALQHGITDIDLLFPDAKSVDATPQFDKRRTEWVDGVLNGTKHIPFSRIKTLVADITHDQARARGYIKGNLKKEEYFGLSRRTTTPTTVYKKQKLDRDDIVDITDFDVVAWMKAEMDVMLREEIARAILIGDGRAVDDEDKVKDPAGASEGAGIRSIYKDHELFAATVNVNLDDAASNMNEVIEQVIMSRRLYKGSGSPTFYSTNQVIVAMLLLKDTTGRRLYNNLDDLRSALMVSAIVEVEPMEDVSDLVGIIVNLSDYSCGTDRGGEMSFFDDFDIDYNQNKYLKETRMSGALTKIRSALVIKKVASGAALVAPAVPTQDDDEVTIVNTTGVTYKVLSFDGDVQYNSSPVTLNMTVTASYPIVLDDGASVSILAIPSSGSYYFANDIDDTWFFSYEA